MSPGIRATVTFSSSEVCPLAALSDREDTTIDSVSRSVSPPDGDASVTEFRLDARDPDLDDAVSAVISYGSEGVYRIDHADAGACPCQCLGEFGCPVERYVASEGTLTLVFHAADFDALQATVAALRDRFPSLSVRRLVRSPDENRTREPVFIDRGKLTERQLEVLGTAYEMGYFERPKQANATEVAARLEINRATLSEHLAAAQQKLIGDVLEVE